MAFELRVLTGARAGQSEKFSKAVVTIGRHDSADFQFDPQQDLDVSGRHAEIHEAAGKLVLHDTGSTNGTFLNGKKISGSAPLRDGDRVLFGAHGPEVEIRSLVPGTRVSGAAKRPSIVTRNLRTTEERVAIAVKEQTAGLKRVVTGVIALVVVGVGVAYVARNRTADSIGASPQGVARTDSTAVASSQVNLPAIFAANSPAIAYLVMDIRGRIFGGTGFVITPEGLIVTNRHNVSDGRDTASRIAVKLTGTSAFLPAHVVKISDDSTVDLALIQMDREGPYPHVQGISRGASGAAEGNSVGAIGYPLGLDTPQEGEVAKATIVAGTISKRTSHELQIDSYATHGASGSPVFNASGNVIGVVYGGQPEAQGRIVYAVPPDKLAAFIPEAQRTVIKD